MDQRGETITKDVRTELDEMAQEWDRKVAEIAGPEQAQMEEALKNLVVDAIWGGKYKRTPKALGTIGRVVLRRVMLILGNCTVDEKMNQANVQQELQKIKDESMKQAVKTSAQFLTRIEPLQEIPFLFRKSIVVEKISTALESLRPLVK